MTCSYKYFVESDISRITFLTCDKRVYCVVRKNRLCPSNINSPSVGEAWSQSLVSPLLKIQYAIELDCFRLNYFSQVILNDSIVPNFDHVNIFISFYNFCDA